MKKNEGFTLIELLLYTSLLAIILLSVSILYSTLLGSRTKNQTIAEVDQQGTQIMQIVTQTIRNAEDINSPSQGTSASSLSANVIDVAKDPTVFDATSGVFRITEGTGTPVVLNNSHVTLSNVTFQNLTRAGTFGTVRIQFTVTHVNPAGRNEYDYNKIFYNTATLRF